MSSLPNASVNVIKHQLYLPAARGFLTFHAILSSRQNQWHQLHFLFICHIAAALWLSLALLLYCINKRYKETETLSNWYIKCALSRADARSQIRSDEYESNYLSWLWFCSARIFFNLFIFCTNVAWKSITSHRLSYLFFW